MPRCDAQKRAGSCPTVLLVLKPRITPGGFHFGKLGNWHWMELFPMLRNENRLVLLKEVSELHL
jgi:hypothetical protein